VEGIGRGEYGRYILYLCMKIEQWNLLKLFHEEGEGGEGERWRG
jgi:hypothetical protein